MLNAPSIIGKILAFFAVSVSVAGGVATVDETDSVNVVQANVVRSKAGVFVITVPDNNNGKIENLNLQVIAPGSDTTYWTWSIEQTSATTFTIRFFLATLTAGVAAIALADPAQFQFTHTTTRTH